MSKIPNSILLEMIPENAIRIVENNSKLRIKFINVLSPMKLNELALSTIQISINEKQIPKSILDKAMVRCKKKVFSIRDVNIAKKISINLKDKFKIIIPINEFYIKPGMNSFHIVLKADTVIDFEFKRKISIKK